MMAIEREYGKYSLECDFCSDCADEKFDSFQDVLDYQKENGWKAVPCGGGIWQNQCPNCQ